MGRARLLVSDFVSSFMWVWSGVLIKIFVSRYLGLKHEPVLEAVKSTLSVINIFFFAWLGKFTHGGAYNPLTVLAGAISGDFSNFLFCLGARIPTQVSFMRDFIAASMLAIIINGIASCFDLTDACKCWVEYF